jgi:predicted nucleotide-binding protein
MAVLRQQRKNKGPRASSDQFIPLQTGSMDLLGKLVQYRLTLVRTKMKFFTELPDDLQGAIYEKRKVDATGDVDVAVGPDGGAVAYQLNRCGSGPV